MRGRREILSIGLYVLVDTIYMYDKYRDDVYTIGKTFGFGNTIFGRADTHVRVFFILYNFLILSNYQD